MTERESVVTELVEIFDAASSVLFDARRVAVDAAAVRAQAVRRLRRRLRRRGYTERQLGALLRVSQSRVHQLLRKTEPTSGAVTGE